MNEIRNDMLPDKSETGQEEEGTTPPIVNEDEKIEEGSEGEKPKAEEPKTETPEGFVPHGAFHQEREKRKDAEKELKEFKTNSKEKESFAKREADEDVQSDEGKTIMSRVDTLDQKIASRERKEDELRVYLDYPILKDKQDEFQEYLEENPGLSPEKAAKLFMFDNNLVGEAKPKRKGLEQPTSGSKKTLPDGISKEDAERLRTEDYRKYERMILSGKLDPDKIGK